MAANIARYPATSATAPQSGVPSTAPRSITPVKRLITVPWSRGGVRATASAPRTGKSGRAPEREEQEHAEAQSGLDSGTGNER
jgi:hypothetical protein